MPQAKLLGLSSLSLEARSPEHGFPGSHLVGFYRKLGFTLFGVLEDFPPGYSRLFFRKRFDGACDGNDTPRSVGA